MFFCSSYEDGDPPADVALSPAAEDPLGEDLAEGLAELGVENGVDNRVEGWVGVAEPGEDLHGEEIEV